MNDLIESIQSCYTDYAERCEDKPLSLEDYTKHMLMVMESMVWDEMKHMTEYLQNDFREQYGYE